jgi:hypothetical protein
MATTWITSNDDEQPLLRLRQDGTTGRAASIRIDDPGFEAPLRVERW